MHKAWCEWQAEQHTRNAKEVQEERLLSPAFQMALVWQEQCLRYAYGRSGCTCQQHGGSNSRARVIVSIRYCGIAKGFFSGEYYDYLCYTMVLLTDVSTQTSPDGPTL